ncbi:CcdC family protein [Desulfosporosinus youngiae]|uniref:Membrane protein involved in cytochrome C biogenesis n=1 Tax=Desulfosporosinus youngiae DSM 17734 TaxID=768710 RepID=H5Y601_9FIRM|nr:cytochrome c biogenesis protein CcdC [Desulfosporosinus youngiae]EHQ90940.1 membrane protein involved in cytochrome C biogenesis [Desulfosporosinus youngiae DSM 17734]
MMLTKQFLVIASIVVSLLMVVVVNLVRLRNTKKPAAARTIILPPLFMATGAGMFILPMFRPTLLELISSVVMGMLFSIILIKTSKFEIRDNQIYLQRSKLFLAALIGLVALRMTGKIVLAETINIDPAQMSGIFFILAFSMILPWRISMFMEFRKLKRQLDNK